MWRDFMIQDGFVTQLQKEKRYERIPFQPEASGLLFRTEDDTPISLRNGTLEPPNGYLVKMLKEYVLLLIRILDKQTQKVDNSIFRLQSAAREHAATAKAGVQERIDECKSLQEQLQVFKGVSLEHRASFPQYDCYSEGPAQVGNKRR